MSKLWIVGQYKQETDNGAVWEFQGVFDNEDDALKACKAYNYFYFEAELGKELSDESIILDTIYPYD